MSFQSDYPTDHCYPQCGYIVKDLNDEQVTELLYSWKRTTIYNSLNKSLSESKVTEGDPDRRVRRFWLNKLYVKLGMIGAEEFGIYNHDGELHFVHLFRRQ